MILKIIHKVPRKDKYITLDTLSKTVSSFLLHRNEKTNSDSPIPSS